MHILHVVCRKSAHAFKRFDETRIGKMNIARELLIKFKSIKGIARATLKELSQIRGISLAKAAQIKACFEFDISTVSIGTLDANLVHPREVTTDDISDEIFSTFCIG